MPRKALRDMLKKGMIVTGVNSLLLYTHMKINEFILAPAQWHSGLVYTSDTVKRCSHCDTVKDLH